MSQESLKQRGSIQPLYKESAFLFYVTLYNLEAKERATEATASLTASWKHPRNAKMDGNWTGTH